MASCVYFVAAGGEFDKIQYYALVILCCNNDQKSASTISVKNFLKPDRHTHKDPDVRIASLESMDGNLPENQIVIERMASTDSEESVRVAAINHLSGIDVLQRVADVQPGMAAAIESRISQLSTENTLSESEAATLLSKQPLVYAPLLAINSANESIRNAALACISDEPVMVKVIEQSRFHDVRLACAKKLEQEDNIKAALIACRSRDKEVAKLLQAGIDSKAAEVAEKKAATESVATTLAAMQAHAESVWSPQYAGRYAALQAKWNALDAASKTDDQRQLFEAVSKQAGTVIQAHETKVAAEQQANNVETPKEGELNQVPGTPAKAVVEPKPVKADPQRDALLLQLKPVKLEELDAFKPNDTQAVEQLSDSDADKLLAHAKSIGVLFNPPFDLTKGRPGAVAERIKRVNALLNTESILPGVDLGDCVYMSELKEHAAALESRLAKAKQESVDRAKATHRQFAALSATIADGKWGPASSMFRRLQKKVDTMEQAERSQFVDKISRAEKQLDEMADWQDFAARPKLEVLCDTMEALPAKELKPEALAKEIKTLQAEWKNLGASRASNELWARFKTAGDTAYEPCKVFFAEKQEERDAKMAAKAELCEQLEKQFQSTDWDAPDWKAIQRLVNNAKRDWSRNRVNDRKPDRALEQRFSDVLKPYDEKLSEQYDANVLEKKDLIEKIKKLAESEINQHSANQAKRLQSAWKQVGIVRRKDDQALWEEFNSHCKVIYKHQHEQQREKYQASMSHVFRARDIIKELRKIAKSSDSDDQQVQALQAEFQSLAEFPEKDKKFLLRDFRGALDACSKVQENATKKRAKAEANEVVRLVELCEQLELAVETPANSTATLRDDVKHAWENSEASVSRETLSKLVARRDSALKHLDAGTQYDYDKNETARRELLIKMEILADKETPAEDKALRMQYQLEHLREGMTSSAVVDKRTEMERLILEWHATLPAKHSAKDSLHSRFLLATNQ